MLNCTIHMGWYSKEQLTPFDTLPIEGLCFRIGDQVARKYECDWYEGHKKPMIALPSSTMSLEYSHKQELLVALGGVALIPVYATSDEAIDQLGYFNSPFHCEAYRVLDDDHQIQVHALKEEKIYFVTYDNEAGSLMDVMVEST